MIVGDFEIEPQASCWRVREIKGTRKNADGETETTYGVSKYCSSLARVAENIKDFRLKQLAEKSYDLAVMIEYLEGKL